MKLEIIDFRKASEELRIDVVKTLYSQWGSEYKKYANIFDEDLLESFLDKQYAVFIFTTPMSSTSPANINKSFIGTITISNEAFQPPIGYKTFWISNLLVIEKYRSIGVGSEMIKYAEDFLKTIGIQYVALTAQGTGTNCSTKICNYYKNHGYKQIGFHPVSGYPIFMKSLL
jgi:GNAT superfamily N-acetyltransferase